MTVNEHIAKLLHEHNCVIIPNFGGFIINDSPSQFLESEHEYLPPNSVVQFNVDLQTNDDLLARSIMKDRDISYSESMSEINQFVEDCNDRLKVTQSLIIPQVGKIFMDQDQDIVFHPNKDSNFNEESFGLPTIEAKKIERAKKPSERKQKRVSGWSVFFTIVASLVALVLAGSLYIVNNGSQKQKELFDFYILNRIYLKNSNNAVDASIEESEHQEADESIQSTDSLGQSNGESQDSLYQGSATDQSPFEDEEEQEFTEENFDDHEEASQTSKPKSKTKKDTKTSKSTSASEDKFHIVVGMYSDDYNAHLQLERAKANGFSDAKIIPGDKYSRVVIPFSKSYYSQAQALKMVHESVEPNAWVWESYYK